LNEPEEPCRQGSDDPAVRGCFLVAAAAIVFLVVVLGLLIYWLLTVPSDFFT
jgi:hypothetical protein